MPMFIAVLDREDGWKIIGETDWRKVERYPYRRGRNKYEMVQDKSTYPVPEKVSAFIKTHKIIEANNREEACRLISTFPRE